jgi:murein DD-endopeptidase MepM/ murein hydrolase activator NlpD
MAGSVLQLRRDSQAELQRTGTGEEDRPAPNKLTKYNSLTPAKQFGLRMRLAAARFANRVFKISCFVASKTGSAVAHFLILPIYHMITMIRLKLGRVGIPAKSLTLSFLTGRYILHIAIMSIAIATIASNIFGTRVNAQDVGQSSILYGMVAGADMKTTEQEARPDHVVKDSRYASETALITPPDIDFDYQAETPEISYTSPSIPGTLVANTLQADQPNQPSGPAKERTETETYLVKDGDTLSVIAQQFGVTVGTILWANQKTSGQFIRPGDSLRIPPVSGVLISVKNGDTISSLAKKYGIDAEEIARINRLDEQKSLTAGSEIVLPGATPLPTISQIAQRPTKTIGGIPINSLPPKGVVYQGKPADANPSSSPISKLLWPTSGHSITQYYGWQHTGLDIDGDYDSPLYAAHDGVVTTAGWNNGGYGLQIIVQGDGVMTRYAHSSKEFVKVGDHVKRGQVIAMMGTTGRSTGTHLHFEVYINGKRTNPLAYLR